MLCIVIVGVSDRCLQFCIMCKKFCFSTQITTWIFLKHNWGTWKNIETVKMAHFVHGMRGWIHATPNHTSWFMEGSQADKYWFLMHNWHVSSWSVVNPTGGIYNTKSPHGSVPPTVSHGTTSLWGLEQMSNQFENRFENTLCQGSD